MKTVPGFVLLYLALVMLPCRAAEHKYSLILAEYGKDPAGKQTQTLVRYHFNAGQMVAKESLLTTRTFDLRYDLGPNQIYRDRFVITRWGDVIDLTTGRMLWKSDGDLVTIDRDSNSVIIRVNRDTDRGIYSFDLNSFRYLKVQQPGLWEKRGVLSPNGQLSAAGATDQFELRDGERWLDQGTIWLRRPDGKEVSLGRFRRENDFTCSELPNPPTFLWLDNEHLLTQQSNGNLVRTEITGRVDPVLTIPGVTTNYCGPQLLRDADNNIYYDDQEHAWLIHVPEGPWPWRADSDLSVAAASYGPYLWQGNGNGFTSEFRQDSTYGRKILHRGIEIGRWWSDSVVTAPGHIALVFGPPGSNLGYPEGVKVWSAENGKWTTIKPEWLAVMIGWVDD